MLYDSETVYTHFLPMFFKYFQEPVAKVSEATAGSLIYILEKFWDDQNRLETIIRVVKKNFLNAGTFKRR